MLRQCGRNHPRLQEGGAFFTGKQRISKIVIILLFYFLPFSPPLLLIHTHPYLPLFIQGLSVQAVVI